MGAQPWAGHPQLAGPGAADGQESYPFLTHGHRCTEGPEALTSVLGGNEVPGRIGFAGALRGGQAGPENRAWKWVAELLEQAKA